MWENKAVELSNFCKKTSDITNNVILLLPLHFTKNICCCRFAFAQKTSAAALRFHTKDICSPSGSLDATSRNGNQPFYGDEP
ncbi:hypothetical protein [Lysinibacillus xylanilyticus]|uniref:Uncharacterized protein n=1 Tax=Lysinibacillus xylanilyticus TaxID=582475 RepID=A0ABT4ESC0_9BACI|nr:hypothetical protein [Lysinibacillus xylanilyticus]MCY9547099.1 hypothetical protein [Lysinibacillus xylanilyticus]